MGEDPTTRMMMMMTTTKRLLSEEEEDTTERRSRRPRGRRRRRHRHRGRRIRQRRRRGGVLDLVRTAAENHEADVKGWVDAAAVLRAEGIADEMDFVGGCVLTLITTA